jgi:hypothetical protein
LKKEAKMGDSKLYLFDTVDATPRFYVVGKTVYRLNGEAVFVIDGEKHRMTPIGSPKPVFRITSEGWIAACSRAVLWSPHMDRILAGAGRPVDVTNMVA